VLVHSECGGKLYIHNEFVYCDICCRRVPPEEIMVADARPAREGLRRLNFEGAKANMEERPKLLWFEKLSKTISRESQT
jgi:hypothetical protein